MVIHDGHLYTDWDYTINCFRGVAQCYNATTKQCDPSCVWFDFGNLSTWVHNELQLDYFRLFMPLMTLNALPRGVAPLLLGLLELSRTAAHGLRRPLVLLRTAALGLQQFCLREAWLRSGGVRLRSSVRCGSDSDYYACSTSAPTAVPALSGWRVALAMAWVRSSLRIRGRLRPTPYGRSLTEYRIVGLRA